MSTTNSYDIEEILKLVEDRESINSKLLTKEKPTIIIKDDQDCELYKICMSPFGDFFIFFNQLSRSRLKMLAKISNVDEFANGSYNMDEDVLGTYISIATDPIKLKASKANSSLSEVITESPIAGNRDRGAPRTYAEITGKKSHSNISWRLIFALPVGKSLEFVDMLKQIFSDDLYSDEEKDSEHLDRRESIF